MNTDCYCLNEYKIHSSPPFISQKSFKNIVDNWCKNCGAEVALTVDNVEINRTDVVLDTSGNPIDTDCCEELFIRRNTELLYSAPQDPISNFFSFVEVGTRQGVASISVAGATYVANTPQTITPTSATVTIVGTDEGVLVTDVSSLRVQFAGMYRIEAFFLHFTGLTDYTANFEMIINAAQTAPRTIMTHFTSGANPVGVPRHAALFATLRLPANAKIEFIKNVSANNTTGMTIGLFVQKLSS